MTPYYELDCTDCSFRTGFVGEFGDVFERIQSHRKEADRQSHFVNVHRRG